MRVVNGKFIAVTAFMPPRRAEINVIFTEMEQKDLELLIFTEIKERGNGVIMEFEVTAYHACMINWL